MAAVATGKYIPTGAAADLETKETEVEAEANITAANTFVVKSTKRTHLEVEATESTGGADDAETELDNAIAAVGGLVLAPGTTKVLA